MGPGRTDRLELARAEVTLSGWIPRRRRRLSDMTQDVVLLGDKTLSLFVRNLNSQLRQTGSGWNAVDAGYDSWLVAPLDASGPLFAKKTAAWAFLLSPRVLENIPDITAQIDALLNRLAGLSKPPTVLFANLFADPTGAMPLSNSLEKHALAGRINEQLLTFRETHPWFYVVDQMGLVLRYGIEALHDPRFEATAQVYYSPVGACRLSELWLRALRALERPQKKVCVVDLDNTLWGGIVGEDGPDGLQMGDSGSGQGYRRFQRNLLELRRSGVLLTVCSKNNYEDAIAVLKSHPDCLLRPEHFAHLEIGWGLKSDAIARTSVKLGLGLDSFVFVDDSQVEREEVARVLPAVDVLEVPADPLQLAGMISAYPGFDTLRQTEEDRNRADAYVREAQRTASRASAASAAEFYQSLQLQLGIFTARMEQADRLHQLLMKTNQFNLTTERLTSEEFRALLSDSGHSVLGMRVSDRFGDSGVTGLAIVDKQQADRWVVENFLLSCRVIGRTVENAFLSWLLGTAEQADVQAVWFRFAPTKRNQVAHNFLRAAGGVEAETGRVWTFAPGKGRMTEHFVHIDDSQVKR